MMRALVFTLLVLGASGEVLTMFLRETSGLKRYVSAVFGLVLLSAFLVPAVTVLRNRVAKLPETVQPAAQAVAQRASDSESDMILSETRSILTGNVITAIHTKFSIPVKAIRVSVTFGEHDSGEMTLKGIHIALTGKQYAVFAGKISAYIGDLFSCPCEVTV